MLIADYARHFSKMCLPKSLMNEMCLLAWLPATRFLMRSGRHMERGPPSCKCVCEHMVHRVYYAANNGN